MRRVYFINRYFYPDRSATSQMLCDLAFALSARGHRVSVITSRMLYDDPSRLLERRESVRGVDIIRLPTTRFGRNSLIGRSLDYLTFYVSLIVVLLRHVKAGDIVVAKTDPPMLSICAASVAWLKRANLINWLQDIFPEVATELGVGRGFLGRTLFGLLRWLRNKTLRSATVNVVLGKRMAQRVAEQGGDQIQIVVVPNWADRTAIRPVAPQQNSLHKDWGFRGCVCRRVLGQLGPRARDAATLLQGGPSTEQTSEQNIPRRVGCSSVPEPKPNAPSSWSASVGSARLPSSPINHVSSLRNLSRSRMFTL
jgi:hypothetical protein